MIITLQMLYKNASPEFVGFIYHNRKQNSPILLPPKFLYLRDVYHKLWLEVTLALLFLIQNFVKKYVRHPVQVICKTESIQAKKIKSLYLRFITQWATTKEQKVLNKEILSWVTNFPCSFFQGRWNTNIRNFWNRTRHTNTKDATPGRWMGNTQMGGEWVIHKSCTIPLCNTINKMRHSNGLAGKIFKFLSTSGLRSSSFPLSYIWSLIQKSHSLTPSSLIMNFDCFQLWCWTSLLFPAFHFTLVLYVSFPWCYLGDD